jgi:restriction system protein
MSTPSNLGISCSIPSELSNKLHFSDVYLNYTTAGNVSSYGIDVNFAEMQLRKNLKAKDLALLPAKIEATARTWNKLYQRYLDQEHKAKRSGSVEEMNSQAAAAIKSLETILKHTLDINDAVDWGALKRKDKFSITPQELAAPSTCPEYIKFGKNHCPAKFEPAPPPLEPSYDQVRAGFGLFGKLFQKKKIQADYDKRTQDWNSAIEKNDRENSARHKNFDELVAKFEQEKADFLASQKRSNNAIDDLKNRYTKHETSAVQEYCEMVLNNSIYPDYFPKNWDLEYRPDSKIVVVDYDLPAPDNLPTVLSYSYIKSQDIVKEKNMTEAARKKLYESVIYQTCIRTLHELFEADVGNAIEAVAFNGVVTNTNPGTGILETKTILSASASKDEFLTFDLAKVDPKATFRVLKGVAAASLAGLTPVPPVIALEKSDKRFIEGKAVAHQLDDSVNLAAMDWGDFEHLIRELFEREFTGNGGEVKVTQASSDGGVDAIAFDPDPLRGGKIVIQAKRYTNTVGVAAVRDLYGTVMNEGATKGILVTTSDYGKDSYEFAKDKPLTLLSGGNLLSLLEKHGHKAKIDIAEAKKLMAV